jgi:tetratricopeptide (TPR) repeat protein
MNIVNANPGRNDPCPCGSGNKYKRCCGLPPATASSPEILIPQEIGILVGLFNQSRFAEAESGARQLLTVQPTVGMLWKILGVSLLRQGKNALAELRKTAQLMPLDAEAHGNLGAALCDQGQWSEALVSLRRALAIHPQDAQVLLDAANAQKGLGRAREALALYQQALTLSPGLLEAQNNLGNAFLELGQANEAAACYRSALSIKPMDAQIHCNLGNALRQLGLLEDATQSTRHAIALEPTLSVAHNNLGLILAAQRQRDKAVLCYREALRFAPDYVEALNNLATVLPELGGRREAMALCARAIDIDPNRAESHCNLGNILFEFRRIDEAAASFRRALALEPEYVFALVSLGAAQRTQGLAKEAEVSCRAALALEPTSVAALSLLGEIHSDRGEFAAAEALFQQSIAIDPGFPFAFFSIATNRRMSIADSAWLKGTEELVGKGLPLRHEISLRYALGKYFDDTQQYEQAFGHYREANELTKHYGVNYDRTALTERVDRLLRDFGADSICRRQSYGNSSQRPVFIVGMPRSGTSLTEQILASHPQVFGAGELAFWQTAFAAYEAASANGEDDATLIPHIAADYLQSLAALSADAQRVVDKMPQNFMNVGLIHAVFPQARIIHLQRHPIDTCLSIYFQYFSHRHPYANDFDNLAHFYSQYVRITDHWRAVLPAGSLLEIPYESLIDDQEGWTRRMLEFVGLPWDAKCLDFHQTDRVVITLSKWQVRQKIHAASAGRWRNYQQFVEPLRRLVPKETLN